MNPPDSVWQLPINSPERRRLLQEYWDRTPLDILRIHVSGLGMLANRVKFEANGEAHKQEYLAGLRAYNQRLAAEPKKSEVLT